MKNKGIYMKGIIIQITLFLFCIYSNAQDAFNNSGNLQIHPGAAITFFGSFTNTSSGVLINNGSSYIMGNIINNQSSMTAGTGTLYMNGSSAQTVGGSQLFKTYNFVSNSSSGITLNNDLSVSGAHTYTAGLITTSSTPNYLIYESGSSYSGSGDSKHVNGWVKKYGSTNFIFPVGDATYERPVAVESMSGTSEFNVKYSQPTPNYTQVTFPIYTMDGNEYWLINKVSGGSASVHLNWDNSKVSFTNFALLDIVVGYYNGSSWIDDGGTATGNTSTTGNVTSNSISSFGNFGFGSKSYPVPVNFISLTAQRKNGYSTLKWVIAQEVNMDHYEIQRSETGTGFTTIGSTPSLNNPSMQEYSYDDYSTLNKIAYYRILCADKDGKTKFSKIVAVYEDSYLTNNLQVLNPTRNYITVRSKIEEQAASILLTNSAGQEILRTSMPIVAGSDNQITLPFKISAGIYFIKISGAHTNYSGKILIY
jgi:hypothetical protein